MSSKGLLLFILLFPLLGSFVGLGLGMKNEKWRDIFNVLMTGIIFLLVSFLYKAVSKETIEIFVPNIMGTGLHLKLNVFRYIFLWITSLIWFLTTIYSIKYLVRYKNRNRYYFFFMVTLASTIGIFISEDLLNLFTFFEIMSLTSYVLVIHDENEYSHEAGNTYIIMAISGGLILLMGLFLLYDYTNTLDINSLKASVENLGNVKYLIATLIIIGFGVKAGMYPLHIWMPKAHPAAPVPASVILSGILVKTGIFGLMIVVNFIMPGDIYISSIIFGIGLLNMFLGGFLAMFQRNIKRILAYSSMSQMGYILFGIGLAGMLGEHSSLAMYGALYHVINHAIFKSILFMVAGVIYMETHELSINEIGGFGKNKFWLKVMFLIGTFSIIGMPGFNGYTGKTLLHMALSQAHGVYGGWLFTVAEVVFVLSSAFTVAYLIKIYMGVFVDKNETNSENIKIKFRKTMVIPIAVLCCLSIYIGVMPNKIYNLIGKSIEAFPSLDYISPHFYSVSHVLSSVYIILLGIAIYILFIRRYLMKREGQHWWYKNYALNWISLEKNVYIPLGKIIFVISSVVLRIVDKCLIESVNFISDICSRITLREVIKGRNISSKIKKMFIDNIKTSIEYMNISENETLSDVDKEIINKLSKANESIEDKTTTIKKEASILGKKANSITYSIFVFAAVLVICLFTIIGF